MVRLVLFHQVGTTKVVFAYHSEDPVSPTEMKHHEFRGVQAIVLLNNMDNRNVDETDWRKFDLTAKNVSCFIDVVFLFGFTPIVIMIATMMMMMMMMIINLVYIVSFVMVFSKILVKSNYFMYNLQCTTIKLDNFVFCCCP